MSNPLSCEDVVCSLDPKVVFGLEGSNANKHMYVEAIQELEILINRKMLIFNQS